MSPFVAIGASALAASAALSGAVRRYALQQSLLDVPNDRSLHSSPTPTGGGLAIVLVVIGGIALMAASGRLSEPIGLAFAGGGALVASIGWLDDRQHVSARFRFLVHAIASVWAVWWLGGMPYLTTGAASAHLGLGGSILAVAALIWAINLYNFMDGIDGLAAVEAVAAGLFGAFLLAPRSPTLASISLLVAAAAAGFLPWNWAPARMFMGDVGSGFLGFMFGALAVATESAQVLPSLTWVVLLGVFFADATLTLVRRLIRGERWYFAHRTHAYQRAVQAGWSHARVAISVLWLDLGLGVLAWWAWRRPGLLLPLLGLAALVLGSIYLLVERRLASSAASPKGVNQGA